ncbi:MAG: hypothetical protein M3N98_01825 [Actinomycetota bacterium]|nr:hypothetical protein [Actinomycetota bacterium]
MLRLQRLIGNQATVDCLQRGTDINVLRLRRLAGNEALVQCKKGSAKVTTTRDTAIKQTPEELETAKSKGDAPTTVNYARDKYGSKLTAAGLDPDPAVSSEIIGKKFPKGPGLTDLQYGVIKQFSKSKTGNGQIWLSEAGMFTVERAEAYLKAHKYQAWLRLDAANRVLLGYMAWRRSHEIGLNVVEGTPAYRLGRSMDAKDDQVDPATRAGANKDIDQDIRDQWVNTLGSYSLNDDAKAGIAQGGARDENGKKMSQKRVANLQTTSNTVLEKVLLLLQAGLQVYDDDDGKHVDYEGAVARALSHGGRVTVRVPQVVSNKDANKLTEWLGVTTKGGKLRQDRGLFTRGFGTHHQAIGKNKKGVAGTGKFREQGGKGAALNSKFGSTQLIGLNLSVGGLGNKDFNGDVILPDGAHGHLLLVWRPPTTDRDGALQIGIETTGPHAKSTVGYKHDANSSEATANPESSFGGLKADKVGSGSAEMLGMGLGKKTADRQKSDAQTNARLVDLTKMSGDWLANLKQLEQQFNSIQKFQAQKNELLVGARQEFEDELG